MKINRESECNGDKAYWVSEWSQQYFNTLRAPSYFHYYIVGVENIKKNKSFSIHRLSSWLLLLCSPFYFYCFSNDWMRTDLLPNGCSKASFFTQKNVFLCLKKFKLWNETKKYFGRKLTWQTILVNRIWRFVHIYDVMWTFKIALIVNKPELEYKMQIFCGEFLSWRGCIVGCFMWKKSDGWTRL